MQAHPLRLALLALALLPACRSGSHRIAQLYDDLAHEVRGADPVRLPTEASDALHEKRADEVRSLVERGKIEGAEDTFKAAVILVGTDRKPDLDLAEELAWKSVRAGEKRGVRVAAEAIDKRLMLAGAPQKYGTQYVFEFVLDSWRLYPVDPATTDADRASMMVPAHAELLEAENVMNRAHGKKPRG